MTESLPAIQRPASVEALSLAVQNCARQGRCVRVVGSDSLPLTVFANPSQAISTTRINKVLEHAVADMTVIVQAGITLEGLQKELAWRNQWLPVDPPVIAAQGRLPGTRTLGGLIASNSLGPLRFGIGDWRMLVLGMKWLDPQGRLIKGGGRTVKNVAGYSIPRLLVGSCGSLGLITEIVLRTFARPADERALLAYCPDAAGAEALLAEIMVSPTTPAYLQLMGGSAFGGNPLALPAAPGVALAAGFLGRPEVCAAQVEVIRKLRAAGGLETLSLTAAQSGRLRQWMTSEPALQGPGAGFRLHVKSSQAAGAIAQIEAASPGAWVVSEAGSGIVRGVLQGEAAAASLEKVAAGNDGILAFTQGIAPAARSDRLYAGIKGALDPQHVFGDAPA